MSVTMILPTLVVAFLVLVFWTASLVKKIILNICTKYPKMEKYALAITPLMFVVLVCALVFAVQLTICVYIFVLGRVLSTPLLYKVLYIDVSALSPLQTAKWGFLSVVAAVLFGVIVFFNNRELTLDTVPFVVLITAITTSIFMAAAHIFSVATF